MKKFLLYIATFLAVLIVVFLTKHAHAQKFQKQYNDWSVYTSSRGGQKLCYMVSFPKRKNGNYRYRSEPYVMVTNVGGRRDEVSVTGGYSYKRRTEPRAIVDGKEYRMSVISGEMAWFRTGAYDRKVISKMKKGMKLKVKGTSAKGTYSIDTYSLRGFTKAYNKIRSLCGSGRRV